MQYQEFLMPFREQVPMSQLTNLNLIKKRESVTQQHGTLYSTQSSVF